MSFIPRFRSLASDFSAFLSDMLRHFGKKPYMLHEAKGFPQYATSNSYESEERTFKKTIRAVPISDISAHKSVISSHTL